MWGIFGPSQKDKSCLNQLFYFTGITPQTSALTPAEQLSRERQAASSLKKTSILCHFAMLPMVNRAACLQQGHLTSLLQMWLQHSWQSAGLYSPPDTSAPTWSCQLPRPRSSPPSPAPAPWGLGHYAPEGCLPGSCPASASGNSDRYSHPAEQSMLTLFSSVFWHIQRYPPVFWQEQVEIPG